MKVEAGFARVDITPPLGSSLQGYYRIRPADGVLDPLLATAIAFEDGEKKAILISVDLCGMPQRLQDRIRGEIARRIEMEQEGVFVHCTHIHQGPHTMDYYGNMKDPSYVDWLVVRLTDVAELAMRDIKPVTYMGYTRGIVEGVSFVRRYRMKDGSIKTNPGRQNPDIVGPVSEPDTTSQLLVIERENAKEIGIINFQVHPDVIGGCEISADYPGFVRRTYEKLVENSLCMYINGAQGDSNHIDTSLSKEINSGYKWSRFMGIKIAASVAAKRDILEEISIGPINFGQKNISVTLNKGRSEQMADAIALKKIFDDQGKDVAKTYDGKFKTVSCYQEAIRIVNMSVLPDEMDLHLTALSVGDWAVAGIPGEPFTEIGKAIKQGSRFAVTMPSCLTNGGEGYFPSADCFEEGGYEVKISRFVQGTAEKLIENSLELVNSLK